MHDCKTYDSESCKKRKVIPRQKYRLAATQKESLQVEPSTERTLSAFTDARLRFMTARTSFPVQLCTSETTWRTQRQYVLRTTKLLRMSPLRQSCTSVTKLADICAENLRCHDLNQQGRTTSCDHVHIFVSFVSNGQPKSWQSSLQLQGFFTVLNPF